MLLYSIIEFSMDIQLLNNRICHSIGTTRVPSDRECSSPDVSNSSNYIPHYLYSLT